jgi:hypothetical protein
MGHQASPLEGKTGVFELIEKQLVAIDLTGVRVGI